MKELNDLLKLKKQKDESKLRQAKRKKDTIRKHKQEKQKAKKAKYNHKYYMAKRSAELQRRQEMGDERALFVVMVVKNGFRYKSLGKRYWKTEAYELFNTMVEKNHAEVKLPVIMTQADSWWHKFGVREFYHEYEIILIQKGDHISDNTTFLRDNDGKFIEHCIVDDDTYKIIAKDKWFIPETYNVYGYDPRRDRKTFDFILNEILLKDIGWDNIKRVFYYGRRVFIQRDTDFDMITCKSQDEALRLYNTLEKYADSEFALFTGVLTPYSANINFQNIQEKTGWVMPMCMK